MASGWWESVMIRRRPVDPGNERLRRIEAVTDAALSSLQLDDLLAELLERTRELLSVDTATILLVDETTDELVATASRGLEEEVRQGIRIPLGSGFAGSVAAQARPVVLDRVDRTTVVNQILIDKHLNSMAGVPMLTPDGVIGVLHVGTLEHRPFGDEDLHLLRLVADRAAMATQARLSQLDRAAALALQRSLLPARPPPVPGFEVAARYIPGARVGVGGDWYDLFRLPSGRLGVVIGDVAGSGLRAAVVMGRIRSALRAYALETDDPADVLTRLDRKVQLFEPNAMATAAYAVIDPSRTTVTVSLAGHLPPVLIAANGAAESLAVSADLPLGAMPEAPRRATTLPLPSGSMLLLYTDGLIERRDRPLDEGMGLLLTNAVDGTAEGLCSQLAKQLLPDAPTDDVAMLALRMTDDEATG
jgi:phosphoserine phosphatase RsbU/P